MENLDILYIHPLGLKPNFRVDFLEKDEKTFFPFIPMGVIGILNNLRDKGYRIRGINLGLKEMILKGNFSLEGYLKSINYKVVLIDMHWYLHIRDGLKVAKLCKRVNPNCVVVVGGMSASIFFKGLLEYPYIDHVIKGDSEESCLQLVDSIFGKKRSASKFDVNKYNYVNIDFMENSRQYMEMFDFWLLIAKGCVFECPYCDGNCNIYPEIYGRKNLIVRNVGQVTADIRKLEGKTEFVGMSQDIAMLGKDFCNRLLENKFKIGVRNEFFQVPSFELIEKMTKSFDRLDLVFSPVSGGHFERRRYGKNFTNWKFYRLLKKIRKLKFDGGVTAYFSDYMVAPRIREKLDARSRERMMQKIKRIYPRAIIEVQNQIIDPMCLIKKGYSEKELFMAFI